MSYIWWWGKILAGSTSKSTSSTCRHTYGTNLSRLSSLSERCIRCQKWDASQQRNSDFWAAVRPVRDEPICLNPSDPGRLVAVKQQIINMTLNGSGVRDIARVLHVSTRTVIAELKKSRCPECCQWTSVSPAWPATGWNVEFRAKKGESPVVMACNWPGDGKSAGRCFRRPYRQCFS